MPDKKLCMNCDRMRSLSRFNEDADICDPCVDHANAVIAEERRQKLLPENLEFRIKELEGHVQYLAQKLGATLE